MRTEKNVRLELELTIARNGRTSEKRNLYGTHRVYVVIIDSYKD